MKPCCAAMLRGNAGKINILAFVNKTPWGAGHNRCGALPIVLSLTRVRVGTKNAS